MDDKTKKIVVGVLAVLALGWGTYTFVLSGPSEVDNTNTNQGPIVRKTHSKPANASARKGRKTRTVRKEKAAPMVRKERKVRDQSSTRRKSRRGKKINVKKAKVLPAA